MLAVPFLAAGGILVFTGATGTLAAVLASFFAPSELEFKPGGGAGIDKAGPMFNDGASSTPLPLPRGSSNDIIGQLVPGEAGGALGPLSGIEALPG